MKRIFLLSAFFFTLSIIFYTFPRSQIYAQVGQIFQTVVGDPELQVIDESEGGVFEGGAGGGGDDNLGPGEFLSPFRCSDKAEYWGWTYAQPPYDHDHTPWAVDFNRGGGNTDYGDPVRASADGEIARYFPSHGEIWIAHQGGYGTGYAHMILSSIPARFKTQGAKVKAGEKIGEIGDTYPGTIQPHLHYQHCRPISSCSSSTIPMKIKGVKFPASLNLTSGYYPQLKAYLRGNCAS